MPVYTGKNFAAGEPLTPLNIDTPCRYVRCNLSNRCVHPSSIVDDCQTAQVITKNPDSKAELEKPIYLGRGVGVTDSKLALDRGSIGVVTEAVKVACLDEARTAKLATAEVVK